MLPILALCSLALPQQTAVRVLARDEDGLGEAAVVTTERPWSVPIPYVTRSETVQRVVPGPDGLRLRVEGVLDSAKVMVHALAHPSDHQVLIIDESPALVGPPHLPRHALVPNPTAAPLPAIARQDGVLYRSGGQITWPPPEGAPADSVLLAMGPRHRRVAIRGHEGHLPAGYLDQVFWAEVAPIPEPVALEILERKLEDGILELRLATPTATRTKGTWTLLVSAPASRDASAVREAGAPGAGDLADRTAALGLAHSHLEGPDEQLDIRPTMGPGAAWGDVDLDGWVDLYLVQGSGRDGSHPPRNRLLRNLGDRFEDVTERWGADDDGAGMGALFFDGDGDADLDLYVANYGADVLYENDMTQGAMHEAGASGGVGGDLWSAGIAASDYDRDGDLDLYVSSYLVFDTTLMPPEDEISYRREDPIEMLPFVFPGQRNTLLRNESGPEGMRFTDATAELKLEDSLGRGMQPVFWDFDRDQDDDLYVANDVSPNVLWRNEGDGRFKDVSFTTGMDDPRGGMGLAIGDVDRDGDEDLFLTNWQLEANALYLNNLLSHRSQRHHVATFRDAIVPSRLGRFGVGVTSWGAALFDAENDGDLDLFVANGYTSPDYESTGICVGQPNHFFENTGEGKFVEAGAKAGPALARELASRCVITCDYDQDGDVDLLITANNGPVQLLRNEREADARGHWLLVRLRGATGNTHGVGAEVSVRAGGRLLRRSLRAGTSYLGGNPPELHFGLGQAQEIEALTVRWPSGAQSTHAIEGVDRVVVLLEPR